MELFIEARISARERERESIHLKERDKSHTLWRWPATSGWNEKHDSFKLTRNNHMTIRFRKGKQLNSLFYFLPAVRLWNTILGVSRILDRFMGSLCIFNVWLFCISLPFITLHECITRATTNGGCWAGGRQSKQLRKMWINNGLKNKRRRPCIVRYFDATVLDTHSAASLRSTFRPSRTPWNDS